MFLSVACECDEILVPVALNCNSGVKHEAWNEAVTDFYVLAGVALRCRCRLKISVFSHCFLSTVTAPTRELFRFITNPPPLAQWTTTLPFIVHTKTYFISFFPNANWWQAIDRQVWSNFYPVHIQWFGWWVSGRTTRQCYSVERERCNAYDIWQSAKIQCVRTHVAHTFCAS